MIETKQPIRIITIYRASFHKPYLTLSVSHNAIIEPLCKQLIDFSATSQHKSCCDIDALDRDCSFEKHRDSLS